MESTTPERLTVSDLMFRPVVIAQAADTLYRALELCEAYDVSQLPVVSKTGELLGIISLEELCRSIELSPFSLVGEAMANCGGAITSRASLLDAARRMQTMERSSLLHLAGGSSEAMLG